MGAASTCSFARSLRACSGKLRPGSKHAMRSQFPQLTWHEPGTNTGKRRAMLMRLVGLLCGLLIAVLAARLEMGTVIIFAPLQNALLMGVLGLLLGASRARWAGPLGVVILLALAVLVERTPLAEGAARGLTIRDRLARSDAVVVLAADIFPDGTPTPQSQRRLAHAYSLLRARWSPRLVLTRFAPPRPSYAPAVRRQMNRARLEAKLLEAGPIRITRDEARHVSILARERGWNRVILVTDRSHTRRAKALFREVGLSVRPERAVLTLSQPRLRSHTHAERGATALGLSRLAV